MEKPTPAMRGGLIEARKLHFWSQQELADLLGTTQNTVSRWELGITTPNAYFTKKLCEVFDASPQALELMVEQSKEEIAPDFALDVSVLSHEQHLPLWSVPYRRNPFFTGRESILDQLHEVLTQNHTVVLNQSYMLSGLGGIGKTQIALEYAYRFAHEYQATFWIHAETLETIYASFLDLAELLHLPEKQQREPQRVAEAVIRWLHTHSQWLLIFDNVEDLALLQAFLPTSHQGSILLTTRLQAVGAIAQQIRVEPLNREEGLTFLLQRAKLLPLGMSPAQRAPAEVSIAQAIVKAMDGLPLALDQVGAYIEETRCHLGDYLQWYTQRQSRFLERRGHSSQDHPASVQSTLSLSCQQVERQSQAAREVLQFCAFLAPDSIPETLITAGFAPDSTHIQAMATDPWLLGEAVAVLGTYSLVQRNPTTKTLSLHRLVQAVLQGLLSEQERTWWLTRVITALHRLIPTVEYEMWSQCEQLVPHVLQCARHATAWALVNEELATLLIKMGTYLMERAQYQQAETLLQSAIHIRKQVLGPEHCEIADPLNSLGRLYNEQGRYTAAEPVLQQAISIREQTLGATHVLVSNPLNNLGVSYNQQGKYEEAKPLLIRALAIREQALGVTHPKVALPLTNLGIAYYEQGKYEEAEPLLLRALHIQEQALGAEHPQVAYQLYNLGLVYHEQGRYAEAESAFMQAIHIREQALGLEHPQTASLLSCLGKLYSRQGRYREAEPLLWRALRLKKQALGSKHPDVAETLYHLAYFFLRQGDTHQAQSSYQQALDLWEKTLGLDHPQVVSCIQEYAHCKQEAKRETSSTFR